MYYNSWVISIRWIIAGVCLYIQIHWVDIVSSDPNTTLLYLKSAQRSAALIFICHPCKPCINIDWKILLILMVVEQIFFQIYFRIIWAFYPWYDIYSGMFPEDEFLQRPTYPERPRTTMLWLCKMLVRRPVISLWRTGRRGLRWRGWNLMSARLQAKLLESPESCSDACCCWSESQSRMSWPETSSLRKLRLR